MAEAAHLRALQEAVKCPVCLDDLKNPVTLRCGHNFCHSCIEGAWGQGQESLRCPVCRYQCRERLVTSNAQLCRMVDMARMLRVSSRAESQGESPLCKTHDLALALFCEEDLELLCPQCPRPPECEGHRVRPVAEAASEHKARVYSYFKPLKRHVAEFQKVLAIQNTKSLEARGKARISELNLPPEVKYLCQFTQGICRAVFLSADEEYRNYLKQKCDDDETAFIDHLCSLKSLAMELTEMRALSEVRLLTSIKGMLCRWEKLKLPVQNLLQTRTAGLSPPPPHPAP
ncbi:putative tripartite motif-containing protein 61 [Ochotona curzoniae]|uniref:putative tripartite motif-containing protein 61 n=1 Tax=Ochotona curzoniae TaxID=130825 RepID=UPI001B34774C|nr:putative tripartite motif-containing protein 61 [Ochotona curzoniae]